MPLFVGGEELDRFHLVAIYLASLAVIITITIAVLIALLITFHLILFLSELLAGTIKAFFGYRYIGSRNLSGKIYPNQKVHRHDYIRLGRWN